MALRSSRELSETSGREMDWEQLQDDSKMRKVIVGDTEASATDQTLERSVRFEPFIGYFKTCLTLPSEPQTVHHPYGTAKSG